MSTRHVLIFAKTKHAKTPYDQWLEGTGIQPIVLTSEEYAPSYKHLEHVHVFSNYDKSQWVEKRALDIASDFSPIAVFARAESDIIRAAQLRTLLGLPGQTVESAMAFRDKVVMKGKLQGSGVLLPEYQAVDSAYTIARFIDKHGYPVVIKPVAESGSTGTQIIHDETELEAYLTHASHERREIETFVAGPMYHVDGLVIGGKIVFIHAFQYINNCLSYRNNEYSGTWTLSPEDPVFSSLVENARRVLARLPTPANTAFHAEFWRTPEGKIVFCEIASRTGGGMISSNIVYSFNLNLDREWFLAECGLAREIRPSFYRPGGGLLIPPLAGTLDQLPVAEPPECIREAQIVGKVGDRFHGGVKSGLFLAGYVVSGANEEVVPKNMTHVAEWFAKHSKWRH